MATPGFNDDDEGKRVVDSTGHEIGIVAEVRGGTAYVDPDPGLLDEMKSKLGWGDADEETYPIDHADVTQVTDDEIHIREFA